MQLSFMSTVILLKAQRPNTGAWNPPEHLCIFVYRNLKGIKKLYVVILTKEKKRHAS